jgi:hypothetical protein
MGGTVSKPKTLTRRQLLEMTQRPRDFVNQLFQVMITQLTPKELLDLGNRAKCKDYVFVMADAIYKTFEAIKVQPTKDSKTGVLFYKKISDVTKGVGGQQTYEHCLSLAYFYVRIFQIFGALSITVSDDPSSGQVLGYLQKPQERPTYGPPVPQIRGATAVPFQARGGYISKEDNRDLYRKLESLKLNFIAPILSYTSQDNNRYKLSFDASSSLQILIGKGSSSINIIYNTDNNYIIAALRISSSDRSRNILLSSNSQMVFTVSGFELRDESLNKVIKKITKSYTLRVEKSDDYFYAKRTDVSSDIERSLTEKLEEIFEKANDDLDKKGVEPGQSRNIQSRNIQGKPSQYDVGVSEGLYTGFIQKYLEHKEKNTLPFCVARAIQLIDVNVLDAISPTAIRTHICETSFEPVSGMVPKAGEGLDASIGLKSLNQLFYSTYYIEKASESDFKFMLKPDDAYLQFLTNLQGVFAADNKTVAKLSDIKLKDPGCDVSSKGKPLQITDPEAAKNIFQTVNSLFQLQADHTKRVIDFMKNRLVEIKSSGSQSTIKLHSNLMKGGVTEINKMAFEVRNILTDYYTKCEKIYQVGAAVAKRAGKV